VVPVVPVLPDTGPVVSEGSVVAVTVLGPESVLGPVVLVAETVPSVTVLVIVVPWLSVADMLPCVTVPSVIVPGPLGSPVVTTCIVALPVLPLLLAPSLAEPLPSSPQLEIRPSTTPKPTTRL